MGERVLADDGDGGDAFGCESVGDMFGRMCARLLWTAGETKRKGRVDSGIILRRSAARHLADPNRAESVCLQFIDYGYAPMFRMHTRAATLYLHSTRLCISEQ